MAKRQWVYRPTDQEHELLLKAMEDSPQFTSVAQVVREGVMRMCLDSERSKMFTEVGELIEELKATKDKFLTLVLKYGDD